MSQEAFGSTLTATGFVYKIISLQIPNVSQGDGIASTTLSNSETETFSVPKLLKTEACSFTLDVDKADATLTGLIGDNLEWTAVIAGGVTVKFWGYLQSVNFADLVSESGTRQVATGTIFLTNEDATNEETAVAFS